MEMSLAFGRQKWYDFFRVEEKLCVKSASDPLLVDVGGGVGHNLIAFKQRFPGLPGKLVLQDIPVVIDSINELPGGIESMKHDFFAAQPVRGAKAYYLSRILHDWPDKQALVILRHIREAMSAHSILLINETLLPRSKVSLFCASLDLMMMANFSAEERTEMQWRALLEQAGLDLVKIWTPDDMGPRSAALIEAVLKM